jgi:ATP-binding cassette subfamily B protein
MPHQAVNGYRPTRSSSDLLRFIFAAPTALPAALRRLAMQMFGIPPVADAPTSPREMRQTQRGARQAQGGGQAPGSPPIATTTTFVGLYRALWHYARGARLMLLASSGLLVASQLVKLAVPWLAAQAIDTLQAAGPDPIPRAGLYVALVMLTCILTWALHGPGRILERSVGVRVRRTLADELYAKLGRLPLSWHDRHHSGDVQQRVTESTGALHGFAQTQFVYLQSVVNLAGPLVALSLLSTTLGLASVAGYLVVGLIILRFDRALMRLAKVGNSAERRYGAGMMDFLGSIGAVIALRLQPSTRRMLSTRLNAVFVPLRRSIVLVEAKWCAVDLLGTAMTWGLVVGYVWQAQRAGEILLMGSIFMIYSYGQQAAGVIGTMASNFQNFARTCVDYASADVIWAAAERRDDCPEIAPDWTRIEVRNLCFEHGAPVPQEAPDHGSTAQARAPSGLDQVSLTLLRGERVALVGPSGSGKSTLMRVLAGLYEPKDGSFVVDGVAPLRLRHLRGICTLIPQEADVFEGSVRENIAFDQEVAPDSLDAAIHASAFDEVMASMPNGLDSQIEERGVNLSGGQRQRLCLARGILAAKDSSMVMLDEPTSALDPLTEDNVLRRIGESFSSACVISSVHRMSLLHHFDKVVLMAAGRVVDTGTVAELLKRQALFREMMGGRSANDGELLQVAAA